MYAQTKMAPLGTTKLVLWYIFMKFLLFCYTDLLRLSDLLYGVQMFLQISRIPNLMQKF